MDIIPVEKMGPIITTLIEEEKRLKEQLLTVQTRLKGFEVAFNIANEVHGTVPSTANKDQNKHLPKGQQELPLTPEPKGIVFERSGSLYKDCVRLIYNNPKHSWTSLTLTEELSNNGVAGTHLGLRGCVQAVLKTIRNCHEDSSIRKKIRWTKRSTRHGGCEFLYLAKNRNPGKY